MTQRVDLATVMDRLAIDEVISGYAMAVDDSDWPGFLALYTPDGRADHRAAGGIEGSAAEVADWLAGVLGGSPVRQHLIGNRRVTFQDADGFPADRAEVRADCLTTLFPESGDAVSAVSRCVFGLSRTDDGWRLHRVVVRERAPRGAGSTAEHRDDGG
ncbi:nuclear transport factor 2 family protein [Streptomyces sp. NP-1717]|uniref:nuclear transport factor 2 family protein n=1 Tax=Streptomyces sp. NP-1717 TaxID=2704470 RepID=UPI001F5E2F18|nr:nuclear transport factor 2 family protein [Streptomyces sp. NP-1717]